MTKGVGKSESKKGRVTRDGIYERPLASKYFILRDAIPHLSKVVIMIDYFRKIASSSIVFVIKTVENFRIVGWSSSS